MITRTVPAEIQNEQFAYDALDRLVESYRPGNLQQVTYAVDGNITSMTGVGNYYYESSKPHALTSVDNTDGRFSSSSLTTAWTTFNKINVILEGGRYTWFVYGPDEERWRSRVLQGSTELRRTYYMGDCEQIEENGQTRRLYYLDDGAIYVKQQNKPDSIWFMFTDRQGSIISLVDYEGNELFCAAYDAWGRQTVERNDIGFHRGYTGHEMLPEYGLVNMNGRLYVPLVCRFLSTDNFVQQPFNSQSFNRYSYCLNNPLKYTDPSGELFGIDDIFFIIGGIAIGGYIGGISTNKGELNPFRWDYKSIDTYLGIGVGGIFGGTAMYGLLNPSTFNFAFSISSPWITVGVTAASTAGALGEGTNWNFNFHWTTAGGGGGSTAYSPAKLDEKVGKIFDEAVEEMRDYYDASLRNIESVGNYFQLDYIHSALDAAGVVLDVADAANAVLYGLEGDYLNAGLSAAAMVPVLGNVATAGKVAVKGYKSYPAFIRDVGKAGDGMNWHHIVEQNPANIKKFGQEMLQNTHNIIRIPGGKGSLHAKISGYYSSIQPFSEGKTVRQWLSTKSFDEQYKFGIEKLKMFGW